ncbi:zeta toxin family protein [Kribbella sp. NPDC054772]
MIGLTVTPAEAEAIIEHRQRQLRPARPPRRPPGQRPRAVVIGGQAGAAKSTIQQLLQAALGKDTTASYDFDDNALAHPRYDQLMRSGKLDRHRDVLESLPPHLGRLCLEALTTRDPQYDVVASTSLAWEADAKNWADGFARQNYRVSVVYVATNDANSLLSVAERYQRAKDDTGIGRWVAQRLHDAAYHGVPETAHKLESEAYVDDIYVVDRDGNVLFENHRQADGTMEKPPGARQAINDERNRPPTPAEMAQFLQTLEFLQGHEPALEEPVAAMASEALTRAAARPRPEQLQRDAVPIDARLAAVQHVAGSGVAAVSGITAPSGADGSRGQDRGRPDPRHTLGR